MKCPKCRKEINDAASFCGYCGQVINKESTQDASVQEPVNVEVQTKQEPATRSNVNKPENESNTKKRKKYIGLKILLIFSIIAIVAGAVLGLLTAKGIIDLSNIIPSNRFEWTDFSEALDAESESATSDEESKEKEDDNETTLTTTEQTNSADVSNANDATVDLSEDGFAIVTENNKIVLNGSFISYADVFENSVDGYVGVLLQLTSDGKTIFAKATKDNIGKTLKIYVGGNLMAAPTVNQEISDGQVLITCANMSDASNLQKSINSIIK